MQEKNFYISDLVSALEGFRTVGFIKQDTAVILENAISELTSLNENITLRGIDHSMALANANFIFVEALEHIPVSTLEKTIQEIEDLLLVAKSSGYENLTEALTILFEDAKKWHEEFKNQYLGYEATDSELNCLRVFAQDLFADGEDACDPEEVKELLTQEHVYPVNVSKTWAGNGKMAG